MIGAWQIVEMEACSLPQKVATGFFEVTGRIIGAKYIPVLYCGEQLVGGTNYMIICRQEPSTLNKEPHLVKLVINESLQDG